MYSIPETGDVSLERILLQKVSNGFHFTLEGLFMNLGGFSGFESYIAYVLLMIRKTSFLFNFRSSRPQNQVDEVIKTGKHLIFVSIVVSDNLETIKNEQLWH